MGLCVSAQRDLAGTPSGVSHCYPGNVVGISAEGGGCVLQEQWEQGSRQSKFFHRVHLSPKIPNVSVFTECRILE